jgi:RecA-family ATPase
MPRYDEANPSGDHPHDHGEAGPDLDNVPAWMRDADDLARVELDHGTADNGAPTDGPTADKPPADPWGKWNNVPPEWVFNRPPRRVWVFRRPGLEGDDGAAGYLPIGIVGCLAGAGGIGKSLIALELAIAAATGRDALGGALEVAPPPGDLGTTFRVLYLAAEETAEELWRRVHKAAERLGLDEADRRRVIANLIAVPLSGNAALALTDGDRADGPTDAALALLARVRELAAQPGPRLGLVIVDPLARFAGDGAEQTNERATRIVQVLEGLAAIGPAVLVVHHTSQAARQGNATDATAVRGVTALTDGFRWVVLLTPINDRIDGYAQLTLSKSNYTMSHPAIVLTRATGDGGGWVRADLDALERLREETEQAERERKARNKAAQREADAAVRGEANPRPSKRIRAYDPDAA